jgi:phospholipid/cholesterol/gamma-HCH transport system permease protein
VSGVPVATTAIDRASRTATLHMTGDVAIASARELYGAMRTIAKRRDIKRVVLDFSRAGRVDSAGLAVVSLAGQMMRRGGKRFDLENLGDVHRAALELLPEDEAAPVADDTDHPGAITRLGSAILDYRDAVAAFLALVTDTLRQLGMVITRRKRLPAGALLDQVTTMGVDAVGIVGLLGALLGMTLGFQGVVLLQRFGAGVFVADMIGVSMVREFGPMMTAIILTGRTGAAIAAELGTMKVRAELDALTTMGVSPTRFLLLPRLLALTIVQPALSLMSMFLGILGGALVASLVLHLPVAVFWARIVERITFGDFVHGMIKSVVFAWVIGFTGSHLGMRASADATSVGAATTRTVVVSVFFIIVIDAVAATISTLGAHS